MAQFMVDAASWGVVIGMWAILLGGFLFLVICIVSIIRRPTSLAKDIADEIKNNETK